MRPRRDVPQDGVRRNEQIRAREVRVIGPEGAPVDNIPALTASTAPTWICGNPDDVMEYIGYLM